MATTTRSKTNNPDKIKAANMVKGPAPATSTTKPVPQLKAPRRLAVDAFFEDDATMRQAVADNLKVRRAGSNGVDARVQQAFSKFDPSQLSADELARRHYVAPGRDPADVLEAAIKEGVAAIRSSGTRSGLTLRNSDELKRLIKRPSGGREGAKPPDGDGSLVGTIQLEKLFAFLSLKAPAGPLTALDPVNAAYKAEVDAERMLLAIEEAPSSPVGDGEPNLEKKSSRDTEKLVNEAVNLQMRSARSPETQLEYSPTIPTNADKDEVQKRILQTFQLRPGASDVTSYHDFNTLQIAFAHVWTRIFDGQLESLGKELFQEYVKLKDFSGNAAPDPTISTLSDLRDLIERVKSLVRYTDEAMPGDRDGAAVPTQTEPLSPKDWTQYTKFLVPDPATSFIVWTIDAIIDELNKAGTKPRLRWSDFDGRQLNRPQDRIIHTPESNVAGSGKVEIALLRRNGQRWRAIEFQQFDPAVGPNPIFRAMISNNPNDPALQYPGGPLNDGSHIVLETSQLSNGLIEFDSVDGAPSEEKRGRYLLADLGEVLKDGTRVTFDWFAA